MGSWGAVPQAIFPRWRAPPRATSARRGSVSIRLQMRRRSKHRAPGHLRRAELHHLISPDGSRHARGPSALPTVLKPLYALTKRVVNIPDGPQLPPVKSAARWILFIRPFPKSELATVEGFNRHRVTALRQRAVLKPHPLEACEVRRIPGARNHSTSIWGGAEAVRRWHTPNGGPSSDASTLTLCAFFRSPESRALKEIEEYGGRRVGPPECEREDTRSGHRGNECCSPLHR